VYKIGELVTRTSVVGFEEWPPFHTRRREGKGCCTDLRPPTKVVGRGGTPPPKNKRHRGIV